MTRQTGTVASAYLSVEDAVNSTWDAVVAGAGMGGAATAFGLANHGFRVLVLEKGASEFGDSTSVAAEVSDPQKRLDMGRWPTQVDGDLDGKQVQIWAPLGCGVGGSTLLYAAALHRLRPLDFEIQAQANRPRGFIVHQICGDSVR